MHFLLLVFFALIPRVDASLASKDCGLRVEYSARQTENKSQMRLEVQVTGGKQPYYFFFFDEKNNPKSWDFKQNYYVGEKNQLPKKIKVIDSKGCFEWIDVNERSNSNG
jgi:hypothetical protein